MNVVFAANEVGSARALIPVMDYFSKMNITFSVVKRGYFSQLDNESLHSNLVMCPDSYDDIKDWLVSVGASAIVFSVNVKDHHPLKIARAANSLGLPTIHVLDYWNGYLDRMMLDGLQAFVPTIYSVPDEYAATKAKQEGIDLRAVSVTGQPAFSDAIASFNKAKGISREQIAGSLCLALEKAWVLFIAEPVLNDQGGTLSENSNFRGYIEADALSILIQGIKQSERDDLSICVLAHPRQDLRQLKDLWESLGGEQVGRVVTGRRGRDLLPFVVGVAGMASTLLYESWIVGVPIISIQPGLIVESMRMLEEKDDVIFIDRKYRAVETVGEWFNNLLLEPEVDKFREDIYRHEAAPENIYRLVKQCVNNASAEERVNKMDIR